MIPDNIEWLRTCDRRPRSAFSVLRRAKKRNEKKENRRTFIPLSPHEAAVLPGQPSGGMALCAD